MFTQLDQVLQSDLTQTFQKSLLAAIAHSSRLHWYFHVSFILTVKE